ncbi:MAG: hypothetical protein QGI37_13410, partial [Verrucomicrobiota bacterium]|nr:hypothetical protein [Verrucomicrobiota bacterium]
MLCTAFDSEKNPHLSEVPRSGALHDASVTLAGSLANRSLLTANGSLFAAAAIVFFSLPLSLGRLRQRGV